MSNDEAVRETALRLRTAWENREPVAPVADQIGIRNFSAAYAVQHANTRHWLENGRERVGRKVGLSSASLREQLGVDEPNYGTLFADMDVSALDAVPMSRTHQPFVEGEVAFVLGADLEMADARPSDAVMAVEYAVPAIEIIGSRILDWRIEAVDTIADNASSGLFVLGRERKTLDEFDPDTCRMSITKGGETVSSGGGPECYGGPLRSLAWLAGKMTQLGEPLRAGDLVLSGALGPIDAVNPGDEFEVSIEGLGTASVRFSVG